MATASVNAVQVGSYFVSQYYQILQEHPDFVHQFYTDDSSVIRVDGDKIESANTVLDIHSLIMSLNFTGIEIKATHSLDSWNGGVLVKVFGSVQTKDYSGRKKFMHTFFLAPQEKGYFVLNDIFHFLDEEQIHQNPAAILVHGHFDSQLKPSNPLPEPGQTPAFAVTDYMRVGETLTREFMSSVHVEENHSDEKYSLPEQTLAGEFMSSAHVEENDSDDKCSLPEQTLAREFMSSAHEEENDSDKYSLPEQTLGREFMSSAHVEENDSGDKYSLPEQPQQQVLEADSDSLVEERPVEESSTSFPREMNTPPESSAVPVEEPVGEPPKKTYASVVAMMKSASSVAPQRSINKSAPPVSEWHHAPQPTSPQFYPALSMGSEKSGAETVEEVTTLEEGEGRFVYVRNLSPTITESEIEQEFNNFGRIKPEGVAIRNRKDIGVCYAFVEFEDALGVQNAIKASPIQLGGRKVHIEEKRANGTSTYRGGRRGNGRGGYPTEAAPRGRFGTRGFGRGNGQDNGNKDFNRLSGNAFHQRGPRQDRGNFGNQVSRNGY